MIETRVTVSTALPFSGTGREEDARIREASKTGAEFHHDKQIKRHFQAGAATRYGYVSRTAKYQKLKKRLGLSSLPLVFSGKTREEITGSREVTATATKGAKLIMKASFPGVSKNFKFKKGQMRLTESQARQLTRVKEIEAITSDELAAVARAEERKYQELINSGASAVRRRT